MLKRSQARAVGQGIKVAGAEASEAVDGSDGGERVGFAGWLASTERPAAHISPLASDRLRRAVARAAAARERLAARRDNHFRAWEHSPHLEEGSGAGTVRAGAAAAMEPDGETEAGL